MLFKSFAMIGIFLEQISKGEGICEAGRKTYLHSPWRYQTKILNAVCVTESEPSAGCIYISLDAYKNTSSFIEISSKVYGKYLLNVDE